MIKAKEVDIVKEVMGSDVLPVTMFPCNAPLRGQETGVGNRVIAINSRLLLIDPRVSVSPHRIPPYFPRPLMAPDGDGGWRHWHWTKPGSFGRAGIWRFHQIRDTPDPFPNHGT